VAAENFKVKKGLEVGTGITANSDGINVTGVITATQYKGDGSGLTGVVASGTGVVIKDEGSTVGTAGTINFVGDGVAATLSVGIATVTINAGALDNVVEDTTPQLGGNLDLNGKFVTGSGGINVTGVVTATTLKGNGDFVDIDVDGQTEVDDLRVAGVSTFIGTLQGSVGSFTGNVSGNQGNFSGTISGPQLNISPGSGNDGIILLNSGGGQNNDFTRFIQVVSDDTFKIENKASGSYESLFEGKGGAEVKLYFAGNQKLTTTINGIEVPDLNATGVGTFGRVDTNGVVLGTNATTFAAKFADNAVANFGTDNDLKISHDDTHARITNTKGNIVVSGIISAISDVKVGSAITMDPTSGIITATSFSGSAVGLTSIPSSQLTGALPSLDGSALTGVTASGSGVVVKHDGTTVGTAGTINFSTNLDVSAISAGIVTITASGGGGGSQNLFSTIAVSGQNSIVADATTDTLTFAEGSNITITTNNSTDTITIASEQRTVESIQDIVGDMFSSNTETDITATYQDDDGTIDLVVDLSSLNADNLDSGIIPNGRFPATLPAVSGVNLTNLTAGNISGTIVTSQITADAVTYSKIQNVNGQKLLGRKNTGSGVVAELTPSEVRTLLNVADGATAGGGSPTTSDIQVTYEITNQTSFSYFRFAGNGVDSSANNPDIYLERGQKYRFINNSGGSHPFQIQTTGGSPYTTGVTYPTGNSASLGNIDFAVRWDAPAQLKYQCTSHGSMQGNIYIHGANGENTNVGITSFSGAVTATSFTGAVITTSLDIGSSNISSGTHTFTASAGTTVTADSTAIGSANVIEYTIYISNSTNIQSQKVLIMDNDTTAYISEFSVMSNPNLIATFSADVNGGNVRLRATPQTGISGSTTIKFTKMIIE